MQVCNDIPADFIVSPEQYSHWNLTQAWSDIPINIREMLAFSRFAKQRKVIAIELTPGKAASYSVVPKLSNIL